MLLFPLSLWGIDNAIDEGKYMNLNDFGYKDATQHEKGERGVNTF